MSENLTARFTALTEDVLIYIISFLQPPEIVRLSKTCKTLHALTSLRIVWTNACVYHVIAKGYPFPNTPVDDILTPDLVYATLHGYALAKRWISGIPGARNIRYISGTSGTFVSEVRFVPGHDDKLLLTISKTVWSALSIWYMGAADSQKVCEWSPRGAIFTGFVLNSDPRSAATIAIALHLNEEQFIKILCLKHDDILGYSFEELYSADTDMKPITLMGDFLALSNDISQTAVWNWQNGQYAILEHPIEDPSVTQLNGCIQVLFAHQSILVARARSIHLFPFPDLKPSDPDQEPATPYAPLAQHSFGWVDGESVTICPFLSDHMPANPKALWQPLSILVRGESDDPWASDIHFLELYTLERNHAYFTPDSPDQDHSSSTLPYIFPPRLSNQVACVRGSLRCKQIILGRFGSAVWIQPRDRFAGGLLADIPSHLVPSSHKQESLVVTAFPGPLNPGIAESVVIGKKMFENEFNTSWTSFDYDEVGGRIALGSSFGRVTILEL
ncbi:hypothetical protein GALMADRAFT_260029 [Galerina marginata CBS 339.88]|uniref:F-box domain-containing protein n=1 Tax=Galerina marginata (strain CBS 339.88) TaxID=685588 RepID=A0A067S7F9_GALM3|nr:hypothetical protein GALMADRAFT_260029 [Galerina marginata CBS 339.88]